MGEEEGSGSGRLSSLREEAITPTRRVWAIARTLSSVESMTDAEEGLRRMQDAAEQLGAGVHLLRRDRGAAAHQKKPTPSRSSLRRGWPFQKKSRVAWVITLK